MSVSDSRLGSSWFLFFNILLYLLICLLSWQLEQGQKYSLIAWFIFVISLIFLNFPFPSASFPNLQILSEAVASRWRDRKQTSAGILVENRIVHDGNINRFFWKKRKKKKKQSAINNKNPDSHANMRRQDETWDWNETEDLPLPRRPQFELLSNKHPSAPSKCSFSVALI